MIFFSPSGSKKGTKRMPHGTIITFQKPTYERITSWFTTLASSSSNSNYKKYQSNNSGRITMLVVGHPILRNNYPFNNECAGMTNPTLNVASSIAAILSSLSLSSSPPTSFDERRTNSNSVPPKPYHNHYNKRIQRKLQDVPENRKLHDLIKINESNSNDSDNSNDSINRLNLLEISSNTPTV